jgi:hypothetical protein
MGADLAVDEVEAALGLGDLFAEAGGKFGKEVAVFAGCGFGVAVQLGYLAREQGVLLGIEGSDIALGVLHLARDAEKLGSGVFPGDSGVDLAMIVKKTLQSFGVSTTVGLIGAGHQQREVLLFDVVACEVGMDTLGDIAEEGLEAGRRVELFGFVGVTERSIVRLLRALTSLLGVATGRVGVVQVNLALGDARFEIIELRVEDADLAEIAALKGLELGAELGKLRFALREHGANAGKLLALVEEGGGIRRLLENDFGWHAASASRAFSLSEQRQFSLERPFQFPQSGDSFAELLKDLLHHTRVKRDSQWTSN